MDLLLILLLAIVIAVLLWIGGAPDDKIDR